MRRFHVLHCAVLICSGLLLSSCLPSGQSRMDEEKDAHFLEGKRRVGELDYQGAIASFERALAVNPNSAAAHFELGWLLDQKQSEPAGAIYHYEHYLKLRPGAENADIVTNRIAVCKQELARTVLLLPVTQNLQSDFEKLTEQNKALRVEADRWRAEANRLLALLNQSGGAAGQRMAPAPAPVPVPPAGLSAPESNSPSKPAALAPASHTHTVKAGETPSGIAKKYGVKLEALMAANPRLDPRRLRPGQTLNIP